MSKAKQKMEIRSLAKAMAHTNGEIVRLLTCVELMRQKQVRRQYELARILAREKGAKT